MAATKQHSSNELRRRMRAPYRVNARVEIAGVTASGRGWMVETIDASEGGIRLHGSRQLPCVSMQIQLESPEGTPLTAKGWVIYSQQVSV